MEAAEAELECQMQDLAQQRAMHPLGDDEDTRTVAPSGLCFPRAAYNMVATTCRLEDIFDTSNSKTNEWLNKAKWLLRVGLEQQAKSSASQHRAALSRPS